MLYTKKGDKGKTGSYCCDQCCFKSSEMAEALGAVDEINSFLGICKVKAGKLGKIIESAQQNLFIVQAVLAGADKKMSKEKVKEIEKTIDSLEKRMPPIKTFFLSGGTEISALMDYGRAIARRAERRVIAFHKKHKLPPEILAYMNRLSSLLYALARFAGAKSGKKQIPPSYR